LLDRLEGLVELLVSQVRITKGFLSMRMPASIIDLHLAAFSTSTHRHPTLIIFLLPIFAKNREKGPSGFRFASALPVDRRSQLFLPEVSGYPEGEMQSARPSRNVTSLLTL
jgi:hypothetical protein